MNGWTLLFGGKIAAVKLMVPWTGVERQFPSLSGDESNSAIIIKSLMLGLTFLAVSYASLRHKKIDRER